MAAFWPNLHAVGIRGDPVESVFSGRISDDFSDVVRETRTGLGVCPWFGRALGDLLNAVRQACGLVYFRLSS